MKAVKIRLVSEQSGVGLLINLGYSVIQANQTFKCLGQASIDHAVVLGELTGLAGFDQRTIAQVSSSVDESLC